MDTINQDEYLQRYKDEMDANARYDAGVDRGMNLGLAKGREEGIAKGREEGREEGLAKGREEGLELRNLQIARDMKEQNFPYDVISRLTTLSIERIEEL